MAPSRPLIGIPADRRMIGLHPFHAVGEKYARAVLEAAEAVPVVIPAMAREMNMDELLAKEAPELLESLRAMREK
jgi:putative glutamine amidotransferase